MSILSLPYTRRKFRPHHHNIGRGWVKTRIRYTGKRARNRHRGVDRPRSGRLPCCGSWGSRCCRTRIDVDVRLRTVFRDSSQVGQCRDGTERDKSRWKDFLAWNNTGDEIASTITNRWLLVVRVVVIPVGCGCGRH